MDILYLFLPAILLLGAVVSYEDIKIGKIRNKWVVLGALVALLLWLGLYLFKVVSLNYVMLVFVYSLAALGIGFFIWFIGLWSAGDAKLYFAFSLLIPLSSYRYSEGFPFITLLANIILPIFVFLVVKILIKSSWNQKLIVVKGILRPKRLGGFVLVIFSLVWISGYLFHLINIRPNYVFNIIAIMGLNKLLGELLKYKFFKEKKITVTKFLMVICILRVVFEYQLILTWVFWKSFLLLTMGYALIRMFISDLEGIFSKKIDVRNLKEGDVLAEMITKNGEKKTISDFGYSQMGQKDSLFELDYSGLKENEIKMIKKLYKRKKLMFKNILMQETMPFAPFIFLGALLTLMLKGNVVVVLMLFFY